MMRLLTTAAGALGALAMVATACGSGTTGGTTPGDTTKTTAIDAGPTQAPEPVGLGMAGDATVLDNGTHVQLASAWLNSHAVVVFYRGHW
jgi:hypothetical protein